MEQPFSNGPPPNRTCTFQRIRLSSSPGVPSGAVDAFRVTLPPVTDPVPLPPFALEPAFPAADYYGGSVAVRVSPFRPSRVPCVADIQVGVGAHFLSLR